MYSAARAFDNYKRQKAYRRLSVQDAFSKIYRENVWGGEKGGFCSGSGSVGSLAENYVTFARKFIAEKGVKAIVDLGCGDFRIGSQLSQAVPRYVGVDIVPELIAYNTNHHSSDTVSFKCLNIIEDPLPDGDLCIIRQVFQHLANDQIAVVLKKLTRFKYVLITEHYPAMTDSFSPNRDKPHGPDTRFFIDSAVVLDAPPYSLSNVEEVLSLSPAELHLGDGETIRTFCWTPNP